MKIRKVLISLVTCFIVSCFIHVTIVQADDLVTDGKAAILIEAETGEILYEKNSHEQLAPASMTKMMSMYLILEAINNGSMQWDEVIRVSEHAASLGGSQIYLKPGEEMQVRDLFKSIAIASANDAVTALAERVAGTEEAFVEKMNAKAKELGMNDTVFKNPTGLTEEGHLTTPYDMSIIGRHLVQDYPEIIEFSGLYEDYIRQDTESPFWLVNTNKLLKYVDGVDGLKTGYTQEAGYCLTATANRGEMRVIAVVMGASKSDIRNQEVTRLIEYAYGQYELVQKLEGQKVVSNGYNMLAKNRSFEIVTSEPVTVLKKKTDAEQESKYDLSLNEEIKLPIQPGDQVGILTYYYNGKAYKEIPLTVKEPVEKNSFIGLLGYIVSQILFGENA
ncbi:MAG: D-alanyl-D-alanine carboxypeptidase family protein [Turicibacter sp.]|uniref:D-alanyl-D-alanine carboxypeptidase family protein n=1 Tax=unclassified Turicibacter TaxID=2638206 RepID=UPI0006C4DE07|nr:MULTISPECIES: D-alanyl-D-alanine carboxypeptidase family protein [unclassified Turicibacter]MCU7194095.1 D-alanyl-D-alanine carboxypeptidase [Turicibacter sp. T129]MCU7207194.1 D-alanyl-D-alanine carboxypeptidase [Turicibacter sp. GALT-G1]CUN36679.1 D-alanyl-D-alanine carboxypeptidase dacC precursor [Turicibacter sanguinis]CUN44030.1 D-alanyl-D-alanine carboxypeptidase dacC precursor [Turicibacter sanguinis]